MDAPGWTKMEFEGGDVFVRGCEIHCDPNRAAQIVITRRQLRDVFGPILEKHGYITTRVPHGMDDAFTQRLGFKKTWADDQYTYYMLDHIPLTKRRKDS